MMTSIFFQELEEFKKDLKKLSKKYKSLESDLEDLKKIIELFPTWKWENIIRVSELWEEVEVPIYKVKKIACKSLKSSKDLRLIYSYHEKENKIILIEFVEIYHKNQKENHNIERIKKYYWNNNL